MNEPTPSGQEGDFFDGLDSESSATTVVALGKSGAGKSKLIEVLKDRWELSAPEGSCPSFVEVSVDGEADHPGLPDVTDRLRDEGSSSIAFLFVVGAPDSALDGGKQLLGKLRSRYPSARIFLVMTRLDLISPVRDWEPTAYDLDEPESKKEEAVVNWSEYVEQTLGPGVDDSVRVALPDENELEYFNVDSLSESVRSAVELADESKAEPTGSKAKESSRNERQESSFERSESGQTSRLSTNDRQLSRRAQQIISVASVASGATGLSSSIIIRGGSLLGVQAGMLIALSQLYGVSWANARAVVGVALSSSGAMGLSDLLRRLLPVDDRIAHGTGASGATAVLGESYLRYLQSDNTPPTGADDFVSDFGDHLDEKQGDH